MGNLSWRTFALVSLAGLTVAAPGSDWASRSIYQVMTDRFSRSDGSTDAPCDLLKYCGGSWTGLINNLDYIQNMGFTAVQISPVDKNIAEDTEYGEAYHGYWPLDKYSINTNFGSADDLKRLSQELHNRGMYLMVDVVINDMAVAINGTLTPNTTIDYAQFIPFNDQKYYHPYCNITDWDNPTMYQDCWFGTENVALPDLDTESEAVVSMTNDWIKGLVANYSIDGLRIDAAKHVNDEFLSSFIEAAGVFTVSEVVIGEAEGACTYANSSGLENYPVYFPLIQAFTAGDMMELSDMIKNVSDSCTDTTQLETFSENHDFPRFASLTPDMALAMNALAFTILADGIPKVYQGQEQHLSGDHAPENRQALWLTGFDTNAPLYNLTAKLNKLRNHAIRVDSRYLSEHSVQLYLDNSTMATRKGPEGVEIVAVFSNQGEKGGEYTLTIDKAFTPGAQVMEIMNCTTIYANDAGNITVPMGAGVPHVYFPVFNLNGSGLCGLSEITNTALTTNTTNSAPGASGTDSKKNSGDHVHMQASTLAACIVFAFAFWLL